MVTIEIGESVLVDERAIAVLIAEQPTLKERLRTATSKYIVVGKGPKCFGLKAEGQKRAFNVPHGAVIKIND